MKIKDRLKLLKSVIKLPKKRPITKVNKRITNSSKNIKQTTVIINYSDLCNHNPHHNNQPKSDNREYQR